MNRGHANLARRFIRIVKRLKWHGSGFFRVGLDEEVLRVGGGFRHVASGHYSDVYRHPKAPGVVFKLNIGNFDSCHDLMLRLVSSTHENLPRVYGVVGGTLPYVLGDIRPRPVAVGVMEELLPSDGSDWESDLEEVKGEVEALLDSWGFEMDDVHSGNVMYRGYTVVVTDPSTYGSWTDARG